MHYYPDYTLSQRAHSKQTKSAHKKKDENLLYVILGTITVAIAVFQLSSNFLSWKTDSANLAITNHMTEKVKKGFPSGLSEKGRLIFSRLLETKRKVDRKHINDIKRVILPLVGLGIGGALLAIGGYKDSDELITAGQMTAAASACIELGVLGYQAFTAEPITEREVRALSREFLQETSYFARLLRAISLLFRSLTGQNA